MVDVVRISKTLSLWLRHKPDDAGLTLDAQGWAPVDAILAALIARKLPGDIDTMLLVVETNDKKRFELSPDLAQIRARQGHSVEVALDLAPATPPALLYHGTVERFFETIMRDGLQKISRHHVHLTADLETAQRVGARRGAPLILEVAAGEMAAAGVVFFRSGNGVWLTDTVPTRFLRRL
ncbi:MAG: RNA 2'-phosphotransferase [Terricaulis silvestris]